MDNISLANFVYGIFYPTHQPTGIVIIKLVSTLISVTNVGDEPILFNSASMLLLWYTETQTAYIW